MTFRYRGFQILATDPSAPGPVLLRVYDPMRPTEELDEFSDPASLDAAVQRMRACLDALCAAEVADVSAAGGLGIP